MDALRAAGPNRAWPPRTPDALPRPRAASPTAPGATPAATLDLQDPDELSEQFRAERGRYLAVRVLLLGEKVSDVVEGGESEAPSRPAPPPAAPPAPAVRAPASAANAEGVRVTVEVVQEHTSVELTATGADGSQATVSVDVQQTRVNVRVEPLVKRTDPLVLDLDGDGVELTSAQDGVRFDLNGDGQAVQAATVAPDDGYLALDRDGDGRITSGSELFGEQHGAAHGFAELARFDDNQDGAIDARDAVYDRLQVWQDRNQNGQSEADELAGLSERGITSLSLAYADSDELVAGNRIAQLGSYRTADGRDHLLADAQLSYLA